MRRALLLAALLGAACGPAAAQSTNAPANATAIEHGHEVFQKWCAPCHAAPTQLAPALAGTVALQTRYKGRVSPVIEQRTDLTREVIEATVRHGQNLMPSFRKTEISDADLDAIAAYLTRPR